MVEEFTEINRTIEKTGNFTMKRKKLFQLMGKANPNLADVISRLGLFDCGGCTVEACTLDFDIVVFNKEKISLAGHDEVRTCTPVPIPSPSPRIGFWCLLFCVCLYSIWWWAEPLPSAPGGVKGVKPFVVIGAPKFSPSFALLPHCAVSLLSVEIYYASLYCYSTE